MTMTDPQLFTGLDVPSILPNDDTARARRSDPLSSHEGADASAKSKRLIMDSVFGRLLEHPSADFELEAWWRENADSLPPALPGSARKRRSDLTKAGLVVRTAAPKRRNPESGVHVPVWGVAL